MRDVVKGVILGLVTLFVGAILALSAFGIWPG
jgi:hypothetical protein